MTYPAIRVSEVWKDYTLGPQASNLTFREALSDAIASPLRRIREGRQPAARDETFWALRDVSFDIQSGEVVGIIGRNGAGKSTLLKVLSRITAPSKGRVEIRGRIASLLEVGTGFHPELTGRENIRLNGAILGMTGTDIARKFDEIVAFAGVEKFIDTPVKRYSSGMQVRLAFAVAAHLEPEILLVDEVLAVGDAEFQKKCLGKMGEISSQGGRTVLFVSHQLGMVAQLCPRAILMGAGSVMFSGSTAQTIDKYVALGAGAVKRIAVDDPRLADLPAVITAVSTIGHDGLPAEQFAWHDPIKVRVELDVRRAVGGVELAIWITNNRGTRVTTWNTLINKFYDSSDQSLTIELAVEEEFVAPGFYTLSLALFEPGVIHQDLTDELSFSLIDSGSVLAAYEGRDYGVVFIPGTWSRPSVSDSFTVAS